LAGFCTAMYDDLNAARGLGLAFDRVRELNRLLDAGARAAVTDIRRELAVVGAATGLFAEPPAEFLESVRRRGQERAGLSAPELESAIAARNEAPPRQD